MVEVFAVTCANRIFFLVLCDFHQNLVKASQKTVILDKLLLRLQSTGHRVLIFSGFTTMLDVLEDYVKFREFRYLRLDGSTNRAKRNVDIGCVCTRTTNLLSFHRVLQFSLAVVGNMLVLLSVALLLLRGGAVAGGAVVVGGGVVVEWWCAVVVSAVGGGVVAVVFVFSFFMVFGHFCLFLESLTLRTVHILFI